MQYEAMMLHAKFTNLYSYQTSILKDITDLRIWIGYSTVFCANFFWHKEATHSVTFFSKAYFAFRLF